MKQAALKKPQDKEIKKNKQEVTASIANANNASMDAQVTTAKNLTALPLSLARVLLTLMMKNMRSQL